MVAIVPRRHTYNRKYSKPTKSTDEILNHFKFSNYADRNCCMVFSSEILFDNFGFFEEQSGQLLNAFGFAMYMFGYLTF